MTPEQQRIAIAEACGWSGCTDSSCAYRKCQHLHKGAIIGFPEPYSTSRYPDYLSDLNAMHEAELTVIYPKHKAMIYHKYLIKLCATGPYGFSATAAQRAEAFLRTIGFKL